MSNLLFFFRYGVAIRLTCTYYNTRKGRGLSSVSTSLLPAFKIFHYDVIIAIRVWKYYVRYHRLCDSAFIDTTSPLNCGEIGTLTDRRRNVQRVLSVNTIICSCRILYRSGYITYTLFALYVVIATKMSVSRVKSNDLE